MDGADKIDEINLYASKVGQLDGIVAVLPPVTVGKDVRVVAYQEMLPRTPESQELIHMFEALILLLELWWVALPLITQIRKMEFHVPCHGRLAGLC